MKLKNLFNKKRALAIAAILLLVVPQMGPLLPRAAADPTAEGPPHSAHTVAKNPEFWCYPSFQGNTRSTFINGNSDAALADANIPSGDPHNTLYSVFSGSSTSQASAKGLFIVFGSDNGPQSNACASSLIFVQSMDKNTPQLFYGLWDTGNEGGGCAEGGRSPGACDYHNIYKYVGAQVAYNTTAPSASTVTFTVPNGLQGPNPVTLNIDASSVNSWFSGGGSGGGGSSNSGLACLEMNHSLTQSQESNYIKCLDSLGQPTFINAATIDYAGEQYVATEWSGQAKPTNQYMLYYLTSSPDANRQAHNTSGSGRPFFALDVQDMPPSGLDIHMNNGPGDPGSRNTIYNALNGINSGKYPNVTLHYNNMDINGNPDKIESRTAPLANFPIIGTLYPGDGTSSNPATIQLLWQSAGDYEAPYWGDYTASPTDPTTYTLSGGGFQGCVNQPEFHFSGDPTKINTTYSGFATATWILPAKDCTNGASPPQVQVYLSAKGSIAPTLPTTPTPTGASSPQLDCSVQWYNPLSWFLCPLATALETVASGLDNEINNYLNVDTTGATTCSSGASSTNKWCGYYQAWSVVRNISLGLIAVFALVAVVSQALGFELLDAYTIRKVLPRLLIAAVGITLSWPLMIWFIGLTNELGLGIRQIIYAPFQQYKVALGGGGQFIIGFFGGGGAIVLLGFAGLLSFVATAALAAALAFLVLTLRQMLIVMLIIFAPIALACYVLPNTQKAWKLWWDSFAKGLLMFPIISAFIAIGRVFAAVNSNNTGSINQIIAFTAYFAPYFLIPFTFRLAGGAISTIAGLTNDRSKGLFDRLKKGRQERMANRLQRAQNNSLWDKNSAIGKRANKLASWATDPFSNAAYYGRNIPGLRKSGHKIATSLEHQGVEQSGKLFEELNKMGYNDKAFRLLSGQFDDLSKDTQTKLGKAGIKGPPTSLAELQRAADILSESDSETERIGANAIHGSMGRLATLYEDPEMGRASVQAAGIMGLAAHGFATGKDIAGAANSLAKENGVGFANSIASQAQLLGQRSRPDVKPGYGVMFNRETGEFYDGSAQGERDLDLIKTLTSHDVAGAKGGFMDNMRDTYEEILVGSKAPDKAAAAAQYRAMSKEQKDQLRASDPNQYKVLRRAADADDMYQSTKDQLFQWAGPYSQASGDVKAKALEMIDRYGFSQEFAGYRTRERNPETIGGGLPGEEPPPPRGASGGGS